MVVSLIVGAVASTAALGAAAKVSANTELTALSAAPGVVGGSTANASFGLTAWTPWVYSRGMYGMGFYGYWGHLGRYGSAAFMMSSTWNSTWRFSAPFYY
jgi:hypothetical protein